MFEYISALILDSAYSAADAVQGLLIPSAICVAIGLWVKGKDLFVELRRAFPQSVLNFKIIIFNAIFVIPAIVLSSQWVADFAAAHNLHVVSPETWAGLPVFLVIAVTIFIGDFIGYWRHRIEHTPLIWPAHAVHHSDEEMNWLTLERFHPVNRLTTFAIDYGTLIVLGLPPYAIIANFLVRHYYGFLIHADLPWTYGKASWVFVSPAMHRWHHSADKRYFQTNFATVFSVFDRAFGTYRVPGPCTSPLGVTDDMQPTLKGQFGYMFTAPAYRRLFDGTATPFRWKDRPSEADDRSGASADA